MRYMLTEHGKPARIQDDVAESNLLRNMTFNFLRAEERLSIHIYPETS